MTAPPPQEELRAEIVEALRPELGFLCSMLDWIADAILPLFAARVAAIERLRRNAEVDFNIIGGFDAAAVDWKARAERAEAELTTEAEAHRHSAAGRARAEADLTAAQERIAELTAEVQYWTDAAAGYAERVAELTKYEHVRRYAGMPGKDDGGNSGAFCEACSHEIGDYVWPCHLAQRVAGHTQAAPFSPEYFARVRADMARNQYAEPEDTERLICEVERLTAKLNNAHTIGWQLSADLSAETARAQRAEERVAAEREQAVAADMDRCCKRTYRILLASLRRFGVDVPGMFDLYGFGTSVAAEETP